MKLHKVVIENFRCFKKAEIDLSADIIAIYGRNGVGKTSVFDAIEYALFGNIGRYDTGVIIPGTNYLQNVFSSDMAKVHVDFSDSKEQWIECKQSAISNEVPTISTKDGFLSQKEFLFKRLVREDYITPRQEVLAVAELFKATMLLSQDSIRKFIEGDEELRSSVLTNISGNAYWQRCLDKTSRVEKEIGSLLRNTKNTIKLLEVDVKLKKEEVYAIKAKIYNFAEQIKDKGKGVRVQLEEIVSAIKDIGFSLDVSEDSVLSIEGIDDLSLHGGNICEEKYSELSEKSKTLVELEENFIEYTGQKKRWEELLVTMEEKERKLSKINSEVDKSLLEKQKYVADIRVKKTEEDECIKELNALSKLPDYRLGRDKIKNQINQNIQNLNQLEEKHKKAIEHADGKKERVASLERELIVLRNAIESEKPKFKKQQGVKNKFYDYINKQSQMARFSENIMKLREGKEKSEKTYLQISEQVKELELEKIGLENKVEESIRGAKEYTTLIAEIKNYVNSSKCPLCGHDHGEEDNLLDEIKKHAEDVPEKMSSALKEKKEIEKTISKARNQQKKVKDETEDIGKQLDSMMSLKEETANWVQGVQVEMKAIDENLSEEKLDKLIEETTNLITSRESSYKKVSDDLEKENIYYKDAVSQIKDHDDGLKKEKDLMGKNKEALSGSEEAILQLGYGDESSMSNDEIPQKIKHGKETINEFRKQRFDLAKIYENIGNQYKKLCEDKNNIEEEKEKMLGIRVSMKNKIEDYENKCKKIKINIVDVSSNLEIKRKEISDQQEKTNKIIDLLERYKWSKKSTILQEKLVDIQKVLDEKEKEISEYNMKREKGMVANDQVAHWSEVLGEAVNSSVKNTINVMLPDIQKLFNAMIPFPYLFDKITMHKGPEGVYLDLKYNDIDESSGDPKFYLSSAQANILALSIFLTFASRQRWSNLETIMLDDPVQHLDDLDAVSFLDNIRSLALGFSGEKKQIIISTCDANFYLLMLKKFSLIEKARVSFKGISILNNGADPEIRYDIGGK